jgi:hypothetical protein
MLCVGSRIHHHTIAITIVVCPYLGLRENPTRFTPGLQVILLPLFIVEWLRFQIHMELFSSKTSNPF